MKRNLDFKMLSLNVRGIRSFDKRKALFNWIAKERSDIIFCKKHIVPQKWKISGNHSGKAAFPSVMGHNIAGE